MVKDTIGISVVNLKHKQMLLYNDAHLKSTYCDNVSSIIIILKMEIMGK